MNNVTRLGKIVTILDTVGIDNIEGTEEVRGMFLKMTQKVQFLLVFTK